MTILYRSPSPPTHTHPGYGRAILVVAHEGEGPGRASGRQLVGDKLSAEAQICKFDIQFSGFRSLWTTPLWWQYYAVDTNYWKMP